MSRKFLKTAAGRALEIAGAVLLAIICFLVFLYILKLLFPSGTPLSELMRNAEPRQGRQAKEYLQGEQPEPPGRPDAREGFRERHETTPSSAG